MSSSVPDSAVSRHLDRLENVPTKVAKADLKNRELPIAELVGRAIQRCFSIAGLTQKEAAALVQRDPAQVARWISGAERPQLDALFAVEQLRHPLVMALAELAGVGVTVVMEMPLKRPA